MKPQDILDGLQKTVNEYSVFAIIWHVIFYILIVALFIKWSPSNRVLAVILSSFVLSVAILAGLSGNPFNGIMFSIIAALLLVFGLNSPADPVRLSQLPFMIAGIVMIIFGLVYPHFIETTSWLNYIYASPAGIIPCPTLCIVIGFILLFNGLGSQGIMLALALSGLFYGIFGVIRLSVMIDVFLIAGAFTLLIKYILSLRTT